MRTKGILYLLLASAIGGTIVFVLSRYPADHERVLGRIQRNLEETVAGITNLTDQFLRERSTALLRGVGDSYFIYADGQPVFWTTNSFVPELKLIPTPNEYTHFRAGGGDYLGRRWALGNDSMLVAVIPLSRRYKITNAYLQPHLNNAIFSDAAVSLIEPGVPRGSAVLLNGRPVFRVQFMPDQPSATSARIWAVTLYFISILALAALLVRFTQRRFSKQPDTAFLLIGAGLIAMRYFMISIGFPGAYVKMPLFDPQFFASSELNPSLGDLLVNAIFVGWLCVLLFRSYPKFRAFRWLLGHSPYHYVFRVFCVLAIFFSILFPFIVIQTIYNNSSITLSITDALSFDGLRITAFVAVVLATISAFLFMHAFTQLLFHRLQSRRIIGIGMVGGALLFAGINEATGQLYWPALVLGSVYLGIMALSSVRPSFLRFSYPTFAYLTGVIVLFSVITSLSIRFFLEKERTQDLVRFATNYLVDRDYLAEYLINEARDRIEQDAFIQTRLAGPFLGKDAIRDKIRQVFLPAYLDRYSLVIQLYNASGQSLDDPAGLPFEAWMENYGRRGVRIEYPGIYYLTTPSPVLTQRYAAIARIDRGGVFLGFVTVEFSLKKYIPESVYPELLVDNRFQQNFGSRDMSYAILSGGEVVMRYGDFDYEHFIRSNLETFDEDAARGFEWAGYRHVAMEEVNGSMAIVSSKKDPVVFVLADFSFQFVLGLFVFLVVLLVLGIRTRLRQMSLFLSARIQLLINLAFFVPLVAVSIITLTLVSVSFREQMDEEYLNKARTFADQLSSLLTRRDSTAGAENQLAEWSRIASVDANLYSAAGRLLATSQPQIFENQIISGYIHPGASARLIEGESNFINTEQVGKLHYFVSYATLRAPQTGRLLGVLGIPFFQSGSALEDMQITVLANILTIFSLIILVGLSLSFFVSGWLTYPLGLITRSLGKTSLTGKNEPLHWRSEDEIGMMVAEYNRMLVNLQHSKAELERSQRERAWREIAQQVAHEIKNPLTPMKLKLQQLQRARQPGEEAFQKTVDSLLTQVDMLNDIAASFSMFAKMPEPKMEMVELDALLRRVRDLHKSSGKISYEGNTGTGAVMVTADPKLLERIFSNLILNAFQAAKEKEAVTVNMKLHVLDGRCRVAVADNGTGMTGEVKKRVFVPHFSTKQSGSGLGLAIARQGIEQMGGSISFESDVDKGTVFYVDLPLAGP